MLLRKNISLKEAACPCCGEVPTDEFLDSLQELRDVYGKPLPFTSMYRCHRHNKRIGGFYLSTHTIRIKDEPYGAADIKTGRYNNRMRWTLITLALRLGFNNIEVANFHTHIARVPQGHSGYNKIVWGVSK